MAGKNWMGKLEKFDGAVNGEYDRYSNIIETPSPTVNFSFGKSYGLPRGFSVVFYGPPKGGKSLLTNATIGHLHQTDPNAWAIKFDPEYREDGQLPASEAAKWGIDLDRYKCFSTNNPMEIFDRLSTEFAAMCQDGFPLALVAIDSLNGIQGRRALNSDTIETQQIGDEALTIQTGLKRVLPVQRKFNIGLIMTAHVRAEMDQLEVKRGNKVRMAASFGVQHHTEYFLYVEQNRNVLGRENLLKQKFEANVSAGISDNKNEMTGHKIRTVMKANSMGPAGRVGEFTLDYNKGIINVHEEVFLLATHRNIITREGNSYLFGGKKWVGKETMIVALRDSTELQSAIVKELKRADAEGRIIEAPSDDTDGQEASDGDNS
jgi:hypothetical protein